MGSPRFRLAPALGAEISSIDADSYSACYGGLTGQVWGNLQGTWCFESLGIPWSHPGPGWGTVDVLNYRLLVQSRERLKDYLLSTAKFYLLK